MSEIVNNITGHKNVCTEVVGKNLCIGCGICASICPRENLKIEFNRFGEYNAFEIGNICGKKCNLCLKVCPFYNNKDNEDTLGNKLFAETPGIKRTQETGYYIDAYVGYSCVKSHRENGASGGLATWTLEKLIADNLVDNVACVSPNDEPKKLFKFKICKTPEEVRGCSRSCYYPVETSEIIKYILQHEGRYAIIGLPCVCKAIRLGIKSNPILKIRIKFILGLVCGQTKSKFFAEYVCASGGGDPYSLNGISFRIKDSNRPASDFGLKWVCKDKTATVSEGMVFFNTEGISRIWSCRYFTPNACNFCHDRFANLTDACFMDAWLSEYSHDPGGYNIVLVRDPRINRIFQSRIAMEELDIESISIERVIRSQLNALFDKQIAISSRQNTGSRYCQRLAAHLMMKISQESPNSWIKSGKDLRVFRRSMWHLSWRLTIIKWFDKFARKIIFKMFIY